MLATKTPAHPARRPGAEDAVPAALVHVVDDEPAIQTLFANIGRVAGLAVATHGSAAEFFAAYDPSRPGCLVLDLNLPDRTGIEVLQDLAARQCPIPVVFMSGMARVSEAVRALKLGSIDFVEKPFDVQVMIDAVRKALATDIERRTSSANVSEIERRFARLSPREVEVMELVVRGAANKDVAARLGLSPKTVEVHRSNVMRKTEANSLAELVRMHLARLASAAPIVQ